MGEFILFILMTAFAGIINAIPLWAVVNLFGLVFNLPFHFTLLQSIVVCALVRVLHDLFFENKGGK